jgi:hypothetical protein
MAGDTFMESSIHYGPKWAWDQSRPEAIEAHRQAAKFYTSTCAVQKPRSAEQERPATVKSLLAKRFRQVGRLQDLLALN